MKFKDTQLKEKENNLVKKTSYSVGFWCKNCGKNFYQSFEYGKVAHQGKCPACGVSPHQLLNDNPDLGVGNENTE